MKIANLNSNVQYGASKPEVSLLLETATSKEIRICLKAGQVMKDHKAPLPITVEIFEGEILFGVGNNVHSLGKGMLLSLEASIVHNLTAVSDSIVRLTISKSDQLKRIASAVE